MIPWTVFSARSDQGSGSWYPVDFDEHWLRLVENGPSMKTFFLDSPMLELAHERQFVVTQQGGNSHSFVNEHEKRMDMCLTVLVQNFHGCTSNVEHCSLTEIPTVEHVGLWAVDDSFALPTCINFDDDDDDYSLLDDMNLSQDPMDSVPVTRTCLAFDRYNALGSTSPIDVEDGSMSEDPEQDALLWRLLHQYVPRASRNSYPQATRARRPVRIRKKIPGKVRRGSFGGTGMKSVITDSMQDVFGNSGGTTKASALSSWTENSTTSTNLAEFEERNTRNVLSSMSMAEIKVSDTMDIG